MRDAPVVTASTEVECEDDQWGQDVEPTDPGDDRRRIGAPSWR